MYRTLIDPAVLQQNLGSENWVVVDCRFGLADTEAGHEAYLDAHIPGAIYAHLDRDLCAQPTTDHGRHPLPGPEVMARRLSRMGIGSSSQVVAYDDSNGAIASRLWWMLHYMSHEAAAVLDGGWSAWEEGGYATHSGIETNEPAQFAGYPRRRLLVRLEEVDDLPLLVDSRAPERYRGEEEPIDPVAGHIPGAVNYFYKRNWSGDSRYLSREQLQAQFETVLGGTPPSEATFHCGSGVTACANLLAMAHAGLGDGRLYVGSWSEWCRDPQRPIAGGDE